MPKPLVGRRKRRSPEIPSVLAALSMVARVGHVNMGRGFALGYGHNGLSLSHSIGVSGQHGVGAAHNFNLSIGPGRRKPFPRCGSRRSAPLGPTAFFLADRANFPGSTG